ncbi:hypothetical protein WN48_06395 [Eufriesea mexicana]|uniref:Uncharacterized protein n=1 Tax=Eufriesea mexicana TaxID=516756 RepID=A0A310SK99_9HYME|nr:hypothetical protein WN48_06395 [Eufriesea mexicana]
MVDIRKEAQENCRLGLIKHRQLGDGALDGNTAADTGVGFVTDGQPRQTLVARDVCRTNGCPRCTLTLFPAGIIALVGQSRLFHSWNIETYLGYC